MQRIEDWLAQIGLERYAAAFANNDIDIAVLPHLTDADLEKIGVSLGHRRKILAAIAELRGTIPAPLHHHDSAERRQLTVMFCDLVGSTALSTRLDPEDMREIVAAYHRCCADLITTAGGFVAKYMGDGVLAYFGYPQAHEHDAERAVRAGLALVEAVPKLTTAAGVPLQVRVGIATGLVVVGDLIGAGAAQEQAVVGETPNLAARLQSLAEPDGVMIAEDTRRLIGGLFDYQDLGAVPLKGFAAPVRAWRVLREGATESRFEALHAATLSPLVGREEELELLGRCWDRARAGTGQVVLLAGEAGIGKSRLVAAQQARIEGEPRTRLRYFCSPRHTDSAFYPIIRQLERVAEFERRDTSKIKLDKLALLLGPSSGQESDTQLVAELLSIPTGARFAPLNWSPQRKKEKTFEALLMQLEMLSRHRPLLMVYEDVHWIDPSTRELLDITVERVARLPVLLVITFRPEFQPPWTGQTHVTTLSLNRLGRREGLALAGSVAGMNAISDAIIDEIMERADGIPLFIEELTKAVVEAGARDNDVVSTLKKAPLSAVTIPATLHASLMDRLDRLGPVAKEIAQIGAAIGREFSYELLAPVAQKSDAEVQTALWRLTDAGLVFCSGTPPQAMFLFKHALVREAAYATLLRSSRQQLHARIGQVLEQRFPDIVELEPEMLAQHYTEARLLEPAVRYWHKAGQRASERSAYAEAAAHLTKGLKVLASLQDTSERLQHELALQTTLGPVLMATKGYASPDAEHAYSRARELCHQLGETPQLFQVLLGLRFFHQVRGALQTAGEFGERLLNLAQHMHSRLYAVQAHTMLGHTLCCRGEFVAAHEHLEQAMSLYESQQHRALVLLSGLDPGVFCRCAGAWALWHLGYPDQALERVHAAVALASELSHPQSVDQALIAAAQVHQCRREEAATRDWAERAIAISQEQGFQQRIAMGTVLQGWALARQGAGTEGIAHLRKGLAAYRATGAEAFSTYYLALLAETHLHGGETEDGLSVVAEALSLVNRNEERWWEAELHRLKGMLVLQEIAPDERQAEICFEQALDVARRQRAKSWELRASTSLARLWRDQGKRTQARDLLAPIYGWFTEGFDTLDLTQARALLVELG